MKILFLLTLLSTFSTFATKREMQFQNDNVNVWKAEVSPNDSLDIMNPESDRIYVVFKGGTFKIKNEKTGVETTLDLEPENAYWVAGGDARTGTNVSDTPIELITIQLKK